MLTNLMTNRLVKPLGFDLGEMPRLSWEDDAAVGVYRVQVATDCRYDNIVFDSGEQGMNPVCYPAALALQPRTRYFWRVSAGEASAESWFETSKLGEPWRAQWITPDFEGDFHPTLFSEFEAKAEIASARVYICGLGLYELSVNGQLAAEEFLSPGLCAYDKWLPYQTYDVTELIRTGENRLSVQFGNGWYKGRYGLNRSAEFHYGEAFALICEWTITYASGEIEVFASLPERFRASRSKVTFSNIFDGEHRDDTLDVRAVYPVKAADVSVSLLEPRRSPPTKKMLELKPVALIETPKGDLILDMGQNMVGWLVFENRAPKGVEIVLEFGEVLQGGEFYRDNLRTAKCEFRYISDGEKKRVRPQFTFYGFRYARLTKGFDKSISLDDFTGWVLYSDMRETGSLTTGNEKVNRLILNTLWGQRGNYLDTPTDCPQRDERMGWTGDSQVFFGTGAYNMDVYAFFTKYCYDLMREQMALGGDVPVVIPKHDVWQTGACAWGDAATIIPWNMYLRYGDAVLLRQMYPSMKAWVDHLVSLDDGSRLWKGSFHYGDWLSLDVDDAIGNRFGGTERTYLASGFYRYSSMLVAKAARVLGYADDAVKYQTLSDEVRAAIVREYVTASGRLAITTQTAYIVALRFDIIPEEYREKTAYALRMKLKESNYHLRTGFVGTAYLCQVLSDTGSNDIAYKLLLQEDFPSWLYEVNMGATTIWERWNSILPDGSISDTGMNSLNHYAYGAVVEWIYRNAAGIQPLECAPGFRKFRLAPQPDQSIGKLDAVFHAPVGVIESHWNYREDGSVFFCFRVPAGAEAELVLPDGRTETLQAGEHEFVCAPKPVAYEDTPIRELFATPEGERVFKEKYPKLYGMMLFSMLAGERSLNDLAMERFPLE